MEVSVAAPMRVIGRQLRVEPDGTRVHLRTCPLCECMCGLEIHLDPTTRSSSSAPTGTTCGRKGYICPKGTTLGQLHDDPDRLRAPMIREGDDVARGHLGRGVRPLRGAARTACSREHGIEAVHRLHRQPDRPQLLARPLRRRCSSGMSRHPDDLLGRHRRPVAEERRVRPDVRRHVEDPDRPTSAAPTYWVIMGGNPQASQGSLLACPDVLGEIDAHPRRAAARSIVVDPRRTGTADRADEWLPDPARHRRRVPAGASCNVLFAEGLVDLGHARRPGRRRRRGARRRRRASRPRRVADVCRRPRRDHPPPRPRARRAPSAAPSTAASACATRSSARSPRWLVDVVNILTGHFDVAGGLMFGKPVAWPLALDGRHRGRRASPSSAAGPVAVRGAPEVLGQVPLSCLAEEIATPGRGPDPGARHRRRQPGASARPTRPGSTTRCRSSTCMISVDNWLNETTRHAHVILPGPVAARAAALRRPDLGLGRRRSAANWTRRRSSPPPTAARTSGRSSPASAGCCTGGTDATTSTSRRSTTAGSPTLCRMYGPRPRGRSCPLLRPRRARAHARPHDPHRPVGRPLRRGPRRPHPRQGARTHPHGIDLGPMVPRARRDPRARPSGKIELAPDVHRRRPRPACARAHRPSRRRPACSSAAATSARTTRGCTT